MHHFITSCISHLENISSVSCIDFLNVNSFPYRISKTIFINNTVGFIRKISSKYWEALESKMTYTSYSEFSFLLESLNFVTGNKYCQLFLWSDKFIWFIFRKMSAKYPSLNNHSYSVPWRRWLVQLRTQSHKCISSRWPSCLAVQKHLPFCMWNIFEKCNHGPRLMKISSFFPDSSKAFLLASFPFFRLWKPAVTTSIVRCSYLHSCRDELLLAIAFAPSL